MAEKGQLDYAEMFTPEAIAAMRFHVMENVREHCVLVHFRAHILRMNGETKEHSVKVPRTWWDHLKLGLPGWLRRVLGPVRWETHTLKVKAYGAVCPHHSDPRPGSHVRWLIDNDSVAPEVASFDGKPCG